MKEKGSKKVIISFIVRNILKGEEKKEKIC